MTESSTLREHLRSHVIPVATALGLKPILQSLQRSVQAALAAPGAITNGSCGSVQHSQTLQFDSQIVTMEKLKKTTRSFRVLLEPNFGEIQSSDNEGILMERYVVLVAALITASTGGRELGLCIRDSTGEIPCEVVPPVPCANCVVLLKKWTLICSGSYGSYLEIEELVMLDRGDSPTQQSLQEAGGPFMTVPDILSLIKSRDQKGLKGVSVVGRLSVISEPFRNGPGFMVLLRITDTSDTSAHCHLITQSPELLCLPRVMKLFEVYTFTHLKSAIMNKGREDEASVLTTTSKTAVERVSAVVRLLRSTSPSSASSPLRKKTRREEAAVTTTDDQPVVTSLIRAHSFTRDATLLSYKGVITRCILPEAGVYELDDSLTLYLTHSNLSNQGRGLREGAEVEVTNAHILRLSDPLYKKMSGFVCCPVGRIEVVHFSEKETNFKAFLPQNKLAQLLSRFRASDVAWLTLVFLSLLKKFKKKREAFSVVRELCEIVGVARVHQDPHSSLLTVPHSCPYVSPVDISLRPLPPTIQQLVQLCKERVGVESFSWRREKERGVAGGSVGPAAPALSVAVSATWSFGAVQHTDFPNPQVLVGRVSGNRVSGYMELCDETGSIPVVVCVPYSPARESDRDNGNPWLSGVREGSTVAFREFSVIAERTEGIKDTKYSFYLHSQDFKIICDDKTVVDDQKPSASNVAEKSLYVCIRSKNCLKQAENGADSKCAFEALAVASSILLELQPHCSTASGPVTVVLGFTSARSYSFLHNHCIYRLSCPGNSQEKLPSLDVCLKEPHITVGDDIRVEMVALPHNEVGACSQDSGSDGILEIGKLVLMFYLPKLKTAFPPHNSTNPRGEDRLVSFRGVVLEHSYRIDCDTTHLQPWQLSTCIPLERRSVRHIIALHMRGINCPNTAMVYCKYRSHEPLPLGLVPGSIAAFHHFTVKSSTRSGNIYFVNSASSSITIESMNTTTELNAVADSTDRSYGMTKEMQQLPVTYIFHLTQRLLQGCLSREVVSVKAMVVAVQHAFIQYQCVSCQCTMVDGQCRPTCPSKKSSLNTDARLLVQDGTGEAHLYVNDRVLPVSLGMTDTEWSDLLDLVHKVGQVSYTKSSFFKCEGGSRPVTVREKAEKMFLDVLTRPSLTRTVVAVCQPFLSPCEQTTVLGSKSHRVWQKHGLDYVTLSLPRLQLRLLSITASNPLSFSSRLLTLYTTDYTMNLF